VVDQLFRCRPPLDEPEPEPEYPALRLSPSRGSLALVQTITGLWGAETPIRGLTRRFRSSDLTAVRHAASKSHGCHSPRTMFTKQVSRPVDSLDPPSWLRRRRRSSDSKKDLVRHPIRGVPYRLTRLSCPPPILCSCDLSRLYWSTPEASSCSLTAQSCPPHWAPAPGWRRLRRMDRAHYRAIAAVDEVRPASDSEIFPERGTSPCASG
jgi:hypothetical protein